ncbi:unnamed protein product [Acanthosepion pharaonis]|uniref:Uncharacterized protein n=1 Tax=Acanthosepion pharaonis TaxID=158019 RepID=A0A812DBY3_ACAPH|nr:unnamed protein product [Sepia pharaonis]
MFLCPSRSQSVSPCPSRSVRLSISGSTPFSVRLSIGQFVSISVACLFCFPCPSRSRFTPVHLGNNFRLSILVCFLSISVRFHACPSWFVSVRFPPVHPCRSVSTPVHLGQSPPVHEKFPACPSRSVSRLSIGFFHACPSRFVSTPVHLGPFPRLSISVRFHACPSRSVSTPVHLGSFPRLSISVRFHACPSWSISRLVSFICSSCCYLLILLAPSLIHQTLEIQAFYLCHNFISFLLNHFFSLSLSHIFTHFSLSIFLTFISFSFSILSSSLSV